MDDRPKKGREPEIDPIEVINATLQAPPEHLGITHWSSRILGKQLGISNVTVAKIWKRWGIKPFKQETFKFSTDPELEAKIRDVVGLYLDPPEKAVVLSIDEKSQIQALDRTAPILPMRPDLPEKWTHDYVRHGTTTLFAALEVATGKVTQTCLPRHRSDEFLRFLKQVAKAYPRVQLHLVVDNDATHKHPRVKAWLASTIGPGVISGNPGSAGCGESRTSGAEGGPGKRAESNLDRAPVRPHIIGGKAARRSAPWSSVQPVHDAAAPAGRAWCGGRPGRSSGGHRNAAGAPRKSLTWDQGSEMAKHSEITLASEMSRCACPWCGDVARPPPIPGDRHGGGIEHDEPIDCRAVTWPAGQEPSVEFRPVQVLVPFEQPLGDPMPGIGIEIPEGRFGHAVTEIPAPAPEHRVQASEEISK